MPGKREDLCSNPQTRSNSSIGRHTGRALELTEQPVQLYGQALGSVRACLKTTKIKKQKNKVCRAFQTDCLSLLASIPHSTLKILLIYLCVCMSASLALACVCTMWVCGVYTCQKWVSDLLYYRRLRATIQVLGPKPRSSERTSALNH